MHHPGDCRKREEKRVEDGGHGKNGDGPAGLDPDAKFGHNPMVKRMKGTRIADADYINDHTADSFTSPCRDPNKDGIKDCAQRKRNEYTGHRDKHSHAGQEADNERPHVTITGELTYFLPVEKHQQAEKNANEQGDPAHQQLTLGPAAVGQHINGAITHLLRSLTFLSLFCPGRRVLIARFARTVIPGNVKNESVFLNGYPDTVAIFDFTRYYLAG